MRILFFLLFLLHYNCFTQNFISKTGEITFFSYAPIEDIKAVNKNVSAAFNSQTNEIVFKLEIINFQFRKKLMQEHFNENYLESDIFPTSTFVGKVYNNDSLSNVKGLLTIHGVTKEIIAFGTFNILDNSIKLSSSFKIKLEDFNVEIPKIVMYKIAEEILVDIDMTLLKIL